MKTHSWLLILSIVALSQLLAACGIPSVHPLYEPDDLIIEPDLSGEWQNEKRTTSYLVYTVGEIEQNQNVKDSLGIEANETFFQEFHEKGLSNLYLILEPDTSRDSEGDYKAAYLGGLLQIDKNQYLDLYKYDFSRDDFSYPVHVFVKVEITDSLLIMHEFRESWLKELIGNRQIRIKHEVSFDNFLLTAPTQELQQFIAKYGNEPRAYSGDTRTFIKRSSK